MNEKLNIDVEKMKQKFPAKGKCSYKFIEKLINEDQQMKKWVDRVKGTILNQIKIKRMRGW